MNSSHFRNQNTVRSYDYSSLPIDEAKKQILWKSVVILLPCVLYGASLIGDAIYLLEKYNSFVLHLRDLARVFEIFSNFSNSLKIHLRDEPRRTL